MNDQDRERFLAKINYGGNPRLAGCWLWTACKNGRGYGTFGLNGRMQKAHRVSYELFNGEIPEGLIVRHTCNNPICVNPAHLIVGTYQDNSNDTKRAGRQSKGEAHGQSKLTDLAVREIRELYAAGGLTQRKIGEMYGVAGSVINRIINYKLWKETS